jgi:hypothetical protein
MFRPAENIAIPPKGRFPYKALKILGFRARVALPGTLSVADDRITMARLH